MVLYTATKLLLCIRLNNTTRHSNQVQSAIQRSSTALVDREVSERRGSMDTLHSAIKDYEQTFLKWTDESRLNHHHTICTGYWSMLEVKTLASPMNEVMPMHLE